MFAVFGMEWEPMKTRVGKYLDTYYNTNTYIKYLNSYRN